MWRAGCSAIRARASASQACGSTPFSLAVTIRLYIAAARRPPRSDPANSHDFLPSAIPRSARSAALLLRHPTIIEEPRERGPALEQVVHRLCEIVAARELRALF